MKILRQGSRRTCHPMKYLSTTSKFSRAYFSTCYYGCQRKETPRIARGHTSSNLQKLAMVPDSDSLPPKLVSFLPLQLCCDPYLYVVQGIIRLVDKIMNRSAIFRIDRYSY